MVGGCMPFYCTLFVYYFAIKQRSNKMGWTDWISRIITANIISTPTSSEETFVTNPKSLTHYKSGNAEDIIQDNVIHTIQISDDMNTLNNITFPFVAQANNGGYAGDRSNYYAAFVSMSVGEFKNTTGRPAVLTITYNLHNNYNETLPKVVECIIPPSVTASLVEQCVAKGKHNLEDIMDYAGLEKTCLYDANANAGVHMIRPSERDPLQSIEFNHSDVAFFFYTRYVDDFAKWCVKKDEQLGKELEFRVRTSDGGVSYKIYKKVYELFCLYMKETILQNIYAIDVGSIKCSIKLNQPDIDDLAVCQSMDASNRITYDSQTLDMNHPSSSSIISYKLKLSVVKVQRTERSAYGRYASLAKLLV
jgi:hypothetical protein